MGEQAGDLAVVEQFGEGAGRGLGVEGDHGTVGQQDAEVHGDVLTGVVQEDAGPVAGLQTVALQPRLHGPRLAEDLPIGSPPPGLDDELLVREALRGAEQQVRHKARFEVREPRFDVRCSVFDVQGSGLRV